MIAALPSSSHQNHTSAHQDGTHAHTRGVEASAAATFAVPWLESLTARFASEVRMPEAGIVRRQTSLVAKTSLKQKLMEMSSYHAFLTQLAAQVSPWICPVTGVPSKQSIAGWWDQFLAMLAELETITTTHPATIIG